MVTLACDIQAVDKTLRVKRILSDGFEVLEAPMPSLVTVSSEIGLPRLPAGMRLMMARKKVVPIWKAQDIGAEVLGVGQGESPYRGHSSLRSDPEDRM